MILHRASLLLAPLTLAACGSGAQMPVEATIGPTPTIAAPRRSLIPTVNVADAVGWPKGATPTPAAGLAVGAFAEGLDHPRWLYVLPNGDVLVAETNAPPKPDDGGGVRSWFQSLFMKKAGSTGASANRITLLRDTDGDGRADLRTVFATGLNSPFGMTLVGNRLIVADTDALVALPYAPGATQAGGPPAKLLALPAGTINHHWTKNVVAAPDGRRLYVSTGSNSNAGERGLAAEKGRAQIWEVDLRTGQSRTFAWGLRNPNGMAFEPTTGQLWTVVNERDELGSDLVPDYLTSVQFGGFYGWPWVYWGEHVDTRVKEPRPFEASTSTVPDYALGAHTASLGLAFATGQRLAPRFASGAFIGQHGSWNRKPKSGYKVIFVPFAGGRPAGPPVDVLTGFLNKEEDAQGRPVGVAIDRGGGLLVADDVGNVVWRVSAAGTGR